MINALNHQFYIPLRERINMLIKYCEPCQMNNNWKLDKCPQEMTSIPIKGQVWSQISMISYC